MMPCIAPCPRYLDCGHKCFSQCGLPCRECTQEVSKIVLNCGHLYDLTCSETAKPTCKQIIETKRLGCGHDFDVICSEAMLTAICQKKCNKPQEKCGHRCERACGICSTENNHEDCDKPCEFKLSCGHPCASR